MKLAGLIPPMITPLKAGGDVDGEAVEKLVNHIIEGGGSGVFIMGSSGEGPWLSSSQRETLITRTVRAAAGRAPVLVGALEPGTERTLEAVRMIEAGGADAVVIASPYYLHTDESSQLQHFERVAAASSLPIVLYNIPQMTHNPIVVSTVVKALQFDNVIAIKDSAGDMENFKALLALHDQYPDFRIFQGAEKLSAQSLLAGADGIVPGLGNIAPQWFVQIYRAASAGDATTATRIQEMADRLWTLHSYDYWLVCLKYAASLKGFGTGATLGHPAHLTDDTRTAIRNLVAAVAVAGD